MSRRRGHARLLIYSHDSFGLGHLRRCRTIAHSLVDHRKDLSVLIISGSPIIGSFDFRARVDFVRVPGAIKRRDADYTSLSLDIGIEDLVAIRAALVRRTAEAFEPDVFLVDKEPLGLRGEVLETLTMLKSAGTVLILGLRDVMDDAETLAAEWERKNVLPALNDLYDHIWVYGLPEICDPLAGVPVPDAVRDKTRFTGYLRRTSPTPAKSVDVVERFGGEPYILVTPGGGGDGAGLVDWVLRAYEHDPSIPWAALLVLGPFMHRDLQAEFRQRATALERVHVITFDAHVEHLESNAAGVVAMGGYNTFCEILSFDKPSLIVPRTVPRLEQFIRAERASTIGLVRMLTDDGERDPRHMAAVLHELPHQQRPSSVQAPGLLDGLSVINGMVDQWLSAIPQTPTRLSVIS